MDILSERALVRYNEHSYLNDTSTSDNNFYKKQAAQITSIISSILVYGTSGLLLFLGFCILRTKIQCVYMPRRRLKNCAPPKIPNGLFSWINTTIRIKESFVLHSVGLDAAVFLRFLKTGIYLFTIMSFLGVSILLPINYAGGEIRQSDPYNAYEFSELNVIQQMTIQNISAKSISFRVHIIFTWIFSVLTYCFIFRFYNSCRILKEEYIARIAKNRFGDLIQLRTVMLFGLPDELRDEESLEMYFNSLGIGKVENTIICRKYASLRKSLYQRNKYLKKIERMYCKWVDFPNNPERCWEKEDNSNSNSNSNNNINNSDNIEKKSKGKLYQDILLGDIKREGLKNLNTEKKKYFNLFGEKYDELEYYVSEFLEWDYKVRNLRDYPFESTPTPVAFVTFSSPISAFIGAQCIIHQQPFKCQTKLAPEPRDLYWKNISDTLAHPYVKLLRSVGIIVALVLLIMLWTIPVAFISSLISVDTIYKYFPSIARLVESLGPSMTNTARNIIPITVVSIWLSFLPDILQKFSILQGIETFSWIEQSLLSKYFFYQLFNIMLIFTVVGTIFNTITDILNDPKSIMTILAEQFPKVSPFFMNYVILQGFLCLQIQLINPGSFLLNFILRFFKFCKTPREFSNASDPVNISLNYGYHYTIPLLIFVIVLTYCCISPLILIFGLIYFIAAYIIYKYQFLYIHYPKYETYGVYAPMIVNRCMTGLIIFQFTMVGIISLKTESLYGIYVGPLIPLSFLVLWWFKKAFEGHVSFLSLETISRITKANKKNNPKKKSNSTFDTNCTYINISPLSNNNHKYDDAEDDLILSHHQSDDSITGYEPKSPSEISFYNIEDEDFLSAPELHACSEFEELERSPFSITNTYDKNAKCDKTIYSSRRWTSDDYTNYQEPKMTRVDGILNVSWDVYHFHGGYQVDEFSENEGQLYTYNHPAVCAGLPNLWLPGKINQDNHLYEKLWDVYGEPHVNEDFQKKLELRKTYENLHKKPSAIRRFFNNNIQNYMDSIIHWITWSLR
ncbi:DUF221-domain-containing protein [Anaeromyces robustus]|uniref:DUF221-domain-containing protein n=1 Tax=Anaeromyces robustus TaxID=1754192 RepID=A0A1Y1XDZ1_9FUNG|nr:DUF221-domain-containing protein [Anaeromyces robustus]|eukprot:ORX83949.1 DUF221-domain-containing protein [Anaeromyces robustus]